MRYAEMRLKELGGKSRPVKAYWERGGRDEAYDKLRSEQGDKCAICRETIKTRGHIDHCHKTGHIRAILCRQCNVGLGMFRDNPTYLYRAAEYAREHATRATAIAAEIAATRPNKRLCSALNGVISSNNVHDGSLSA